MNINETSDDENSELSPNQNNFKIPFCNNHRRHLIPIVYQSQVELTQQNIDLILSQKKFVNQSNDTKSMQSSTTTKISTRTKKDRQFVINQWISAINFWAANLIKKSYRCWKMALDAKKFRTRIMGRKVLARFYQIHSGIMFARNLRIRLLKENMERWYTAAEKCKSRKAAFKLAKKFSEFCIFTNVINLWNRQSETSRLGKSYVQSRRVLLLKASFDQWVSQYDTIKLRRDYVNLRRRALLKKIFSHWTSKLQSNLILISKLHTHLIPKNRFRSWLRLTRARRATNRVYRSKNTMLVKCIFKTIRNRL